MRVRKDLRRLTMRVSIINPKKKGKKRKSHKGQTRKQRAASIRNLKKARRARKSKGSHAPKKKSKSRKGKKRTKKARKTKKRKSKKARKSRKGQTRKQRAASLKNLRKARAARKGKRKGRKAKSRRGKKVRPVMYRGKTRKGKKVLRHSPRSKYARRGYRFNPADAVKGIAPKGMQKYMPSFKGAKLDVPHGVGGVIGFVTAGYGGGMMRVVAQKYSTNEYIGHGASLVGNILGTEIPAVVVNYAMHKTKGLSKHAEKVARGVRIGGYVALVINGATIVLKVLKVGNLPFRIPSELTPTKELVLNGLGDIDLVSAGLGNIVQGLGDFVSSQDYAGLGDDGLLDTEIAALSAYVGEGLDDFSGLPVNDRGLTP